MKRASLPEEEILEDVSSFMTDNTRNKLKNNGINSINISQDNHSISYDKLSVIERKDIVIRR